MEPGLAGAELMQVLKHELAIIERAKRVDEHDVIKRTWQRFNKAGRFDVACIERITGMGPPRFLNRRGAQIDTDTKGRLELRQKLTGRASKFEDAHARGNQEGEIVQVLTVKERSTPSPLRALRRRCIGPATYFLFTGR